MWNNASTELPSLPLLNSISGVLTPAALLAAPIVDPLQSLSLSGSSTSRDLAAELRQVRGTLTFNNGQITSDLTSPFGNLQGPFNLVQFANDLATSLQQLQGSITITQGIATSNLTTPSGPVQGRFEFARVVGDFVRGFIQQIEGSVPIDNGVLQLNLPTPFGAIAGTLDLGQGGIVADLTTPLGRLAGRIDLGAQARIPLEFAGLRGVADFSRSQIIVSSPFGSLAVPMRLLDGSITFRQGQTVLNVQTPIGSLSENIDLSGLLDTFVTDALSGNGTISFTNGVVSIDTIGPLGIVRETVSLPQVVRDFATAMQQAQGTVSFDNGIVTSNLTTPLGNVIGSFNLTTLVTALNPLLLPV